MLSYSITYHTIFKVKHTVIMTWVTFVLTPGKDNLNYSGAKLAPRAQIHPFHAQKISLIFRNITNLLCLNNIHHQNTNNTFSLHWHVKQPFYFFKLNKCTNLNILLQTIPMNINMLLTFWYIIIPDPVPPKTVPIMWQCGSSWWCCWWVVSIVAS